MLPIRHILGQNLGDIVHRQAVEQIANLLGRQVFEQLARSIGAGFAQHIGGLARRQQAEQPNLILIVEPIDHLGDIGGVAVGQQHAQPVEVVRLQHVTHTLLQRLNPGDAAGAHAATSCSPSQGSSRLSSSSAWVFTSQWPASGSVRSRALGISRASSWA